MKNYIKPIVWTEEMGEQTITKDDVDFDNQRIEFYNSLPANSDEKKTVGEYLHLVFSKPIGEILNVDFGIPLKEKLSKEEKKYRGDLCDKVHKILKEIHNID